MALSALVTLVGSSVTADPQQFTAQSPSLNKYVMTNNGMIDYGDAVGVSASYPGGPVPAGYIHVQYHENNQWKTGKYYTSQNGAAINTLVVA